MIDNEQTKRIQAEMLAVARAHSVPIVLIRGERAGEHLGTGTVVQMRGKPYLLTCDHIARKRTEGSLAIGLGHGSSPIRLINSIPTGDSANDVAVSRLDEAWLRDGSVLPLAASYLAESAAFGPEEPLFLYGFPSFARAPALAAVFDADKGRWSSTSAVIMRPVWPLPPNYDPQLHFSIRYSADEMLPVTSGTGFADPGGLSGSAVWRTGATSHDVSGWSPDLAQVIGMAIEWHPKYSAIVCLRIEVIRRFVLRVLVQEAAYFRWIDRGKPEFDDWADWFSAESTIRDVE